MKEYNWPLMKDTLTWRDRFELAKFVLTADRFTQGVKVEEFEQAWSNWLGVPHSVYVTSGSTANFLLMDTIKEAVFKNKKNIKVLLPACTWVTNINPIMQLGMTPIFCDVNLKDYSFDENNMKAIARKHKIDMVFATHLLGIPANISKILDIFPNAFVFEDVCESHGARHPSGAKVGSVMTASTFSFYFGHHMSTIEGGMVSTTNKGIYDLLRLKRSHGMSRVSINPETYTKKYPDIDPQFLFVTAGYNFRNTELGAVLGLSQLKRLDNFIDIRRKNFALFMEIMEKTNKFHLPRNDKGNSSFCFPLIAKTRDTRNKLIDLFNKHGVEYRPVVGGNLLRQPYMKGHTIACKRGPYNADIIHDNGVYIGNNQFVNENNMKILEKILGELNV